MTSLTQASAADAEGAGAASEGFSAGNIFDIVATEIEQQLELEQGHESDLEQTAVAKPGHAVKGTLEWQVVFEGFVRVRSSAGTSGNNTVGKKGPQGAIVVGKATSGWVKLLTEPGYVAITAGGQSLLHQREVSYMIIPHGGCKGSTAEVNGQSAAMNSIPDSLFCTAAATTLGYRKADTFMENGDCLIRGDGGHKHKVCSTRSYDGVYVSEVTASEATDAINGTAPVPTAPANDAAASTTEAAASIGSNTTTGGGDEACDGCCPQGERPVPTVVIPVYERDLCKLKMTAQSITQHDKVGVLGKVIICWVSSHPLSDYGDQMEEVKRALEPHGEVEVIELAVNGEGWKVQQAAKLKVASRVYSDFYVVLDAKNTILRDLEEDTFFTSCNQAKIFGRYEVGGMPGVHRDWYYNSASVLEVDPMDYGKWPASITPMTMHTQTVKDMLDKIGEPQDFGDCSAGLCDAFGRDATEFTLYVTYVGRIANMWCIHDIEERPFGNEIAVSIWRTENDADREDTFQQVEAIAEQDASQNGKPIFFGAQAGALNGFEGDQRFNMLQNLFKVYDDAGLYSFSDWDDMASCAIGSHT